PSIIVRNKKAYFNSQSLQIYDLTDPYDPKEITENEVGVDGIRLQGKYLYSAIGETGLDVFDISNPVFPTQVSHTPFPVGIPRNLGVDGKWAIGISNKPYSINLFDISDPKNPVPKESYIYEKYPNVVEVSNGYAYVARGIDGLDIFKITPDGSLELITNIETRGYAHSVVVSGNRAYVVRDGADIYDITDPRNPTFLEHINSKGEANSVAVDNGYIYIADGYAGMTIVEVPE
ncbi:MAG: hypothetical protein IH840_11810, partial [Candidatus Heimdallarchaeota archaeon]|nr:hypothetical protein [Candidatus Heimdallarchaeota archaeon]